MFKEDEQLWRTTMTDTIQITFKLQIYRLRSYRYVWIVLLLSCMTTALGAQTLSNQSCTFEKQNSSISLGSSLETDLDMQLLSRVANIYNVFRNCAKNIWGDSYRFDKRPLVLLYRSDAGELSHGYVINHPKVKDIATAELVETISKLDLPPVYKISKLPRQLQNTENFDFQVKIAGVPTFAMVYTSEATDAFAAPISPDWDAFLVHEGLHDQQIASWKVNVNELQDIDNYPLQVDDIANIWLEHQLLIDALRTTDLAQRDSSLKAFIAIRADRMEGNRIIRNMDGAQERYEGTALYLEYKLAEFIPNNKQLSIIDLLSLTLEENVNRDELAFGRFYSTGAALSMLLDDLGLSWKAKVESGMTQFEILNEHYAMNTASKASLLEKAQSKYSFDNLLDKAHETVKTVNDSYQDISTESDVFFEQSEGYLEEVMRPYQDIESIIKTKLSKEYVFLGAFTVESNEIDPLWAESFSPEGNLITFYDYDSSLAIGSEPYRLRITESQYCKSLEELPSLNWLPNITYKKILDTEIAIDSFKEDDFVYSEVILVHEGQLYVLSASTDVSTLEEVVKEIILRSN